MPPCHPHPGHCGVSLLPILVKGEITVWWNGDYPNTLSVLIHWSMCHLYPLIQKARRVMWWATLSCSPGSPCSVPVSFPWVVMPKTSLLAPPSLYSVMPTFHQWVLQGAALSTFSLGALQGAGLLAYVWSPQSFLLSALCCSVVGQPVDPKLITSTFSDSPVVPRGIMPLLHDPLVLSTASFCWSVVWGATLLTSFRSHWCSV